jgi:hypothetical protein
VDVMNMNVGSIAMVIDVRVDVLDNVVDIIAPAIYVVLDVMDLSVARSATGPNALETVSETDVGQGVPATDAGAIVRVPDHLQTRTRLERRVRRCNRPGLRLPIHLLIRHLTRLHIRLGHHHRRHRAMYRRPRHRRQLIFNVMSTTVALCVSHPDVLQNVLHAIVDIPALVTTVLLIAHPTIVIVVEIVPAPDVRLDASEPSVVVRVMEPIVVVSVMETTVVNIVMESIVLVGVMEHPVAKDATVPNALETASEPTVG